MKRKVLFITPSLRQGGVEHSLVTNLKLLNPQKYDITLYLYLDMLDLLPEIPEYVKVILGVDKTKYFRKPYCILCLLCFYLLNFLRFTNAAKKVQKKMYAYIHQKKVEYPNKKYFKNDSFHTIISHSLHIGTEMGLKIAANKYCLFMRSSDPNYHRETAERTLDKYSVIVCVSPGVKAVMSDAFPEYAEKMIVIENYVDANRVIKLAEEGIPIKIEADLIISTCGRLSHEKGFDLAVEAAAILKNKNISFHWLFIGDGDERENLESMIKTNQLQDNITITGFTENPFSYIKQSDIYVQPSYEESYGRTIKEAIILGKPVVSTDTIGANVVLKNGEYGKLVPISAQGIADGILLALRNTIISKYYGSADNIKERKKFIASLEQLIEE